MYNIGKIENTAITDLQITLVHGVEAETFPLKALDTDVKYLKYLSA